MGTLRFGVFAYLPIMPASTQGIDDGHGLSAFAPSYH